MKKTKKDHTHHFEPPIKVHSLDVDTVCGGDFAGVAGGKEESLSGGLVQRLQHGLTPHPARQRAHIITFTPRNNNQISKLENDNPVVFYFHQLSSSSGPPASSQFAQLHSDWHGNKGMTNDDN